MAQLKPVRSPACIARRRVRKGLATIQGDKGWCGRRASLAPGAGAKPSLTRCFSLSEISGPLALYPKRSPHPHPKYCSAGDTAIRILKPPISDAFSMAGHGCKPEGSPRSAGCRGPISRTFSPRTPKLIDLSGCHIGRVDISERRTPASRLLLGVVRARQSYAAPRQQGVGCQAGSPSSIWNPTFRALSNQFHSPRDGSAGRLESR